MSMEERFSDYESADWGTVVASERISGARDALFAFGGQPESAPLDIPDFYPQVRPRDARATERMIAQRVASRLAAAVADGDPVAWRQAELGLYYLMTVPSYYDAPDTLAASALLWLAGVLCPAHPWAEWWIFTGAWRTAHIVESQKISHVDELPDALGEILVATCRFVSPYAGGRERIPSGTATILGKITGVPPISNLVTEAAHLDEETVARETGIVSEPDGELGARDVRRRMAARFGEKLKRVSESVVFQDALAAALPDAKELDAVRNNVLTLRAHMERRHDYGRTVDWSTWLDGDPESNVSLNSLQHIRPLAFDWRVNGNEASGRHAVRLWRSWLEQSPLPSCRTWEQWRTLEVGNRLSHHMPLTAAALMDREDFRELVLPDLARWTFLSIRYLVAFSGPPNNWFQIETAGALLALEFFPDWPEYGRLRAMLERRLRWINDYMFLDDGMQSENAPGYHLFPWNCEVTALTILEALGGRAPDGAWACLEKGAEPMWKLRLPDGSLPAFSDCGPRVIRVDAALKNFAEMRKKPDLVRVLEPDGVSPLPDPCQILNDAGYSVMRTGWGAHDAALAFDHGFFGTNHQHEDKLSFVYYAHGRLLIGDPGIYRYVDDDFERYFRGAWGHNVVMIDGRQQARILKHLHGPPSDSPYVWPIPDPDAGSVPGTDRALVWGTYADGFAERTAFLWSGVITHEPDRATRVDDWVHRRVIAFFGSDGIVVVDRVESKSGDTHAYEMEQIFHLAPFLDDADQYVSPGELARIADGFELSHENKTGVRVRRIGGDCEMMSWCGSTDPVRGYTALGGEMPSHDIAFRATMALPATFLAVIEPIPSGGKAAGIDGVAFDSPDQLAVTIRGNTHRFAISPTGAAEWLD